MNPAEFANIARVEQDFWWYRGMQRILFRALDPFIRGRSVSRVLEAGCGTGFDAACFERRYSWRVFPIDLEMQGLAYARKRGLQRLVQTDLRSLPFRSENFDLVTSLDVLIHFPPGAEDRAVAELSRVLAPGGLLVLRVSALDILRSRHSEFTAERQRFTRRRLADLAARHGVRVLRCTYINALLFPVALAKFRLWEPLTRATPRSGVEPVSDWLNRLLGWPLALESLWIGAGLNFPLGQTLLLIGEKSA